MALDDSRARIAIWTEVVPMLSIEHPFLMHGLLAVSAAHIAHTEPDLRSSYLAIAHIHHDRGLELFQQLDAACASRPAPGLQEAKVMFILMKTVLSLALVERTRDAEGDLDSFADWLATLSTSFRSAHQLYNEVLNRPDSRISALLRRPEDGPAELSTLDEDLAASLDMLDARNRANGYTLPVDREHVSEANSNIKLWMSLVSLRPRTAIFVAMGAMNLGDEFFRLVRQRNPEALILMAHFLVPMSRMPKRWFWEGWFDGTIVAILRILPTEEWQKHLKWVRENVNASDCSISSSGGDIS
ncbi:hypothetical protein LQW54_006339 [Pestalotiopsis sp. IQ-011]